MFGQTTSSGMFGQASPSLLGQPATPSPFGQTTPAMAPSPFGQITPAVTPSPFGQPQQTSSGPSNFGGQQTPTLFGQIPPQQQSSIFGQPQLALQTRAFGQPFTQNTGSIFGTPQTQAFQSSHLTTQMAPVAPLVIPLPDREVQAFIDAYIDEPGNPKYGFKVRDNCAVLHDGILPSQESRHLLLSVTDPSVRMKPVGVSDIIWAEAMNKLDGMDRADRERLWPEVVHGFQDLSKRLKLQDEAIDADVQRLQATETNVKLLHRHFETDTLPWIQRLRQNEQEVQRRLLRAVRIVEALEGKGFRNALTTKEARVGEQLRSFAQQLQGPVAEFPRKIDGLRSRSRMQVGVGQGSAAILGLGKIDEQSLLQMQEVIRQQTGAIAHLTAVLERDVRDLNIVIAETEDMSGGDLDTTSWRGSSWNGVANGSKHSSSLSLRRLPKRP